MLTSSSKSGLPSSMSDETMQRIVSEPALQRSRELCAHVSDLCKDAPQVLADRVGDATEQDAWRVNNSQASDGCNVGRDDLLRVRAGLEEPLRDLFAEA